MTPSTTPRLTFRPPLWLHPADLARAAEAPADPDRGQERVPWKSLDRDHPHNSALEARHKPLRFGERDTKESLLDLGRRMLGVLCANVAPGTEVLAVEHPFAVPLIDQETGEVLDRDLVGSLDLLERDREGRLVVVDLKTAARKYTDVQVEASLQLSIYSYAASMLGFADQEDVRLRFDVLTKTRQPELERYWTSRDRAANVRLFRLAAEVLRAIEAGAFHPIVGWQCKDCPYRSRCWAWR